MDEISKLIDEIVELSVDAGLPCPQSIVEPVRALYALCGATDLYGHRARLREAIRIGDAVLSDRTEPARAEARRRALIAFHMGTDLAEANFDTRIGGSKPTRFGSRPPVCRNRHDGSD